MGKSDRTDRTRRIRKGGSLAPTTVKDIARHAGVSPATVSLVLRKSPRVAEATQARIESSIDALGYVYHRAAANLRTRLTYTVGLVVCEITNPFYAELTAGIDEALDQRRLGRLSRQHRRSRRPVRTGSSSACASIGSTGCLLCPAEGHRCRDSSSVCGSSACRWCRFCAASGGVRSDHVGADFRLGMTLAAEHLIRLGHRRIAFVGGGRHASPARDRAHAYRETLARHGLPVGPIVNCLPTREEGERAVAALARAAGRRSDGDHLPQRPLRARRPRRPRRSRARRRPGLRGDRLRQYSGSGAARPALTTIDIGARQIGEEAAKLLLRAHRGADGRAGKHRFAAAARHSLELRRPIAQVEPSSRLMNGQAGYQGGANQ